MRLTVAVANRRFHARELERLTGLQALEGQAQLLLNDLREYRAWLEANERRAIDEAIGADRWIHEVLEPSLAVLVPAIGLARDPLQAYCDVLEQKWILSELVGTDVGPAGRHRFVPRPRRAGPRGRRRSRRIGPRHRLVGCARPALGRVDRTTRRWTTTTDCLTLRNGTAEPALVRGTIAAAMDTASPTVSPPRPTPRPTRSSPSAV